MGWDTVVDQLVLMHSQLDFDLPRHRFGSRFGLQVLPAPAFAACARALAGCAALYLGPGHRCNPSGPGSGTFKLAGASTGDGGHRLQYLGDFQNVLGFQRAMVELFFFFLQSDTVLSFLFY